MISSIVFLLVSSFCFIFLFISINVIVKDCSYGVVISLIFIFESRDSGIIVILISYFENVECIKYVGESSKELGFGGNIKFW